MRPLLPSSYLTVVTLLPHGPDITVGGEAPLRASLESPVLESALQAAVDRLNPSIPAASRQEAIRQVLRIASLTLSAQMKLSICFIQGVPVSYQKDNAERGDFVRLLDFDKIKNEQLTAVNQFTIIENNANKRPDIVLFINGLPLGEPWAEFFEKADALTASSRDTQIVPYWVFPPDEYDDPSMARIERHLPITPYSREASRPEPLMASPPTTGSPSGSRGRRSWCGTCWGVSRTRR